MNRMKALISAVTTAGLLTAAVLAAGNAARQGDIQVCSQQCVIGPSTFPHIGLPLQQGSTNVRICGAPAARQGDPTLCTCNSSVIPGVITSGSPSVLINGQPAARQNSTTSHGGVITSGCASVIVGP